MSAKKALIVDDVVARHIRIKKILVSAGCEKVASAFSVAEAICYLGHSQLNNSEFDMLCLDHDMNSFDDGRTLANWISESTLSKNTKILIHSQNPSGAEQMHKILSGAGFVNVQLSPYRSEPE